MAEYTITHTCVHTTTQVIKGIQSKREKKRSWFQRNLCTDCFKSQERERGEEQIRVEQADGSIPSLSGSDEKVP